MALRHGCLSHHHINNHASLIPLSCRGPSVFRLVSDAGQLSRRRQAMVAAQAQHGWDGGFAGSDLKHLEAAAVLSASTTGLTQPHPNAACLIVDPTMDAILASSFQRAQGTVSAEAQAAQAVQAAGGASSTQHGRLTAYCNLEPGDCHGETAAVRSLLAAGVGRVVVGLRHPLPHLRGGAVAALRAAGVQVDVLSDRLAVHLSHQQAAEDALSSGVHGAGAGHGSGSGTAVDGINAELQTLLACIQANEALLHRAVLRRPLSILKYAMTLDGKIATNTGHSAWVSSPASRAQVFEQRARSDAVIVGGNTVRRDDPRLTTRQEGGHTPCRIVMSRSLDLPTDAKLWDVSLAPTIVMTQKGARRNFQQALRARGVEVVEFDFLTPECVAHYCYERGFLQCFWECGGTLAAPTISSNVIHKVMAFVAPKVIGGLRAPTPVGEMGFVEMTQALDIIDASWKQVGPDILCTGYLPASGGLLALVQELEGPGFEQKIQDALRAGSNSGASPSPSSHSSGGSTAAGSSGGSSGHGAGSSGADDVSGSATSGEVRFYKAWDQWGALSNFSPHPIRMLRNAEAVVRMGLDLSAHSRACTSADASSGAASTSSSSASSGEAAVEWPSVEHYYQAHKFSSQHANAQLAVEAVQVMSEIAAAPSPEEAARIGRRTERSRPELLRADWASTKQTFMYAALCAKFTLHEGPRDMLLSTASPANSAEASSSTPSTCSSTSAATSSSAPRATSNAAAAAGPAASVAVMPAPSRPSRPGMLLLESSPHDRYWGAGYDKRGANHLGRLLMKLRQELLQWQQQQQQ